jgi:hypothetical protein
MHHHPCLAQKSPSEQPLKGLAGPGIILPGEAVKERRSPDMNKAQDPPRYSVKPSILRSGSHWESAMPRAMYDRRRGLSRVEVHSTTQSRATRGFARSSAAQPYESGPTCARLRRRYAAILSGPCDVLASLPAAGSNGGPDPRFFVGEWHLMMSQRQLSRNDFAHARRSGYLAQSDLNPNGRFAQCRSRTSR